MLHLVHPCRRDGADGAQSAKGCSWMVKLCVAFLGSARAARAEFGALARAGLLWKHSRGRVEERGTTSSEGQGNRTTTGTGGYGHATGTSSKRVGAQSSYE